MKNSSLQLALGFLTVICITGMAVNISPDITGLDISEMEKFYGGKNNCGECDPKPCPAYPCQPSEPGSEIYKEKIGVGGDEYACVGDWYSGCQAYDRGLCSQNFFDCNSSCFLCDGSSNEYRNLNCTDD